MDAITPRPKSTGPLKALLLGILAALAIVTSFAWRARTSGFVAQDACLDAGGRWSDGVCDGARPGG